MPPSLDSASTKASDLLLLPASLSATMAHHITARVFGFEEWIELTFDFALASRSRFGGDLVGEEVCSRRGWQYAVLKALLTSNSTPPSNYARTGNLQQNRELLGTRRSSTIMETLPILKTTN
jgi:hypothetical protein